ncbi:growth/differentiation factor 8-like isoform X1 [Antedon mediterranea]|uniref:growth/differentiation factor 8-like isoform X1 n=1 Tax=Antedon mediterranea TaxID=105859 RepID=UPI003AF6D553
MSIFIFILLVSLVPMRLASPRTYNTSTEDVRATGNQRQSEDQRVPEVQRASEEKRTMEGERKTDDHRAPEDERATEDERITEDHRSSDDQQETDDQSSLYDEMYEEEIEVTANETLTCSNCEDERVTKWQIELIKSSLLHKLGLTHPPKIAKRPIPDNPPILEHLHQIPEIQDEEMFADEPVEYTDMDDTSRSASIQRVLILATEPKDDMMSPNVVCFNIGLDGQDIAAANLWMYAGQADVVQRTVTSLRVYMIIPATPTSPVKRKLYKEKTISLSTTDGSWEQFDAKPLMMEWMKDTDTKYQYIEIEATDGADNNVVITGPNDRRSPALSVEFTKKRRHGRSHNKRTHKCHGNSSVCCMQELKIDFRKFGWDWVIAPTSFNANYCKGECPISAMMPPGSSLYLNHDPSFAQCCSPTSFKPLTIIYYTDNQDRFVVQNVADMIVESCNCR